jgi:type I restriction enzyme S subunit
MSGDGELLRISDLKHTLTSGSRGWARYEAVAGDRFIGLGNLRSESIRLDYFSKPRFVMLPKTATEGTRTKLKVGDILLSVTAELGLVGYVDDTLSGDAYVNQHVALLRLTDPRINSEFLAYCFASNAGQKAIARLNDAGAKSGLSLEKLRRLQLHCLPLDEQNKIAQILRAWETVSDYLAAKITGCKDRKRGLMQRLLAGKTRFKEFASKKWTRCALGDVVQSVSRPVAWNESELYCLASVRRNSGGVFSREELFGHQIKVKKLQTIRSGDFLISHIQAAYGAMALVPDEFDGAKVSELYTILRPKDPKLFDIRFLAYLGQTKRMWYMAIQASNGFFAERLRLNFDPEEFLRLPVDVPPMLAEQVKIVAVLSACDSEIKLLEKQLAALKEQKRGLMQKLLTGEIRVKTN